MSIQDSIQHRLEGLNDALDRVQSELTDRVDAIETKTAREAKKLLRRIKGSRLAKRVNAVPKRVTSGVDRALDRVGLMRKARHEDLMERAKRRSKTTSTRRKSKATAATASAA